MSTAVMSTPMYECNEHIFKNTTSPKAKEPPSTPMISTNMMSNTGNGNNMANGHLPLKRSYTSLMTTLMEQHRKLDRSVSEPTSRYKTELCRPYEESGACKYGDKCQFAHGYNELRNLARHPKYKTELCRTFHTIGFCPYGPRCHFIHNFEEARIHNQKVKAQLGSTHPNVVNVNPLMSITANGNGVDNATNNGANNANVVAAAVAVNRVNLLEQLAASSHVAVAAAAAAVASNTATFVRTNSLSLTMSHRHTIPHQHQHQHQHHHHHHHHHQINAMISTMKPKPLSLGSPTFSLGSTADSVSPSSSLSQSPTNSMVNFFSDDYNQQAATPCSNLHTTTPFSFSQDFALLATRQSPSPRNNNVSSPFCDENPRTPSPLSPNTETRLPVFNRISSTLCNFENLKL